MRDTTLNETFIVGAAVGAAMTGTIPVAELQFADFMLIAGDEVFHKMAKWRYMHGGQLSVPMVLRLPTGVLGGVGAEHSQIAGGAGDALPRPQSRAAGDPGRRQGPA